LPNRRQAQQADVTFRVMRLLETQPDISQRELAQRLGVSLGGLHYCLRALASKGLVKMQSFGASRNKLGYAYLLTPKGLAAKAEMTGSFLKRKVAEYEALQVEIEALRSELGQPAPGAGLADPTTGPAAL
jgi:EPS-associated MarR family transcriptional regulator